MSKVELCAICGKALKKEHRVVVDGRPVHSHHSGVAEHAEGIPPLIRELMEAGSKNAVRRKMAEKALEKHNKE